MSVSFLGVDGVRRVLAWLLLCVTQLGGPLAAAAEQVPKHGIGGVETPVAASAMPAQQTAEDPLPPGLSAVGVVFEDYNANGRRDVGEPGIEDVPVSNGREVVRTDVAASADPAAAVPAPPVATATRLPKPLTRSFGARSNTPCA